MIFTAFAIFSFTLKSLWNLVSLAKDLRTDLDAIKSIKKNHVELLKRFNEFIRFHTDVKQLSEYSELFHYFNR